jgi:hypothetical protein
MMDDGAQGGRCRSVRMSFFRQAFPWFVAHQALSSD